MTETLMELVDNKITDKNTIHSYIDVYERLFSSKKENAKNILEIGMFGGGSMKLWRQYFKNADIFGVDLVPIETSQEYYGLMYELNEDSRTHLYTSTDGYDEKFIQENFLDADIEFDIIVDDGPHSLESQINCINLYTPLMAKDGILVIEDIQRPEFLSVLCNNVVDDLKQYIEIYDLRHRKNRYDDIMFVINLNK